MAVVNQIEKKMRMNNWEAVKYQLLTYCYLYKISVSDADLDCLTFLALEGEQELTSFCSRVHEKKIFSSPQSVRNCLTKAAKKNLIVKEGKNKKKITINPTLNVFAKGNLLLNFKILSLASQES